MTNPQYTADQIEEITETSDAYGVEIITDVVDEDYHHYSLFDQGKIYQIINNKTAELLADIKNQRKQL